MLSTAVSMAGNVLRTLSGDIPFSYGVYFLGSNVSVWAIPPPIQRTMTESAVALGLDAAASAPRIWRARPAARALRVAAEVWRKERREKEVSVISSCPG